MAKSVQLPDGSWFPLREGEDPRAALSEAAKLYPEAFGIKPKAEGVKRDTTGLKAAAAATVEQMGGQFELLKGKLGFKDQAAAQKEYEAAQQRARERFTPTEKGWTEEPFLKFRETLGGSLPLMAAPAAAGLAALAAPVAAPVAAGLGLGAAGLTSAGQFTMSNLGRQVDTNKSLEQADLGKAFAAAVPQALLDTAAMALLPGVGKLFGSVGSKLTTEQAKAIASQTLTKTLGDYAVKTGGAMTREGFTEAAQQALERVQAGLNIADPEARKEYIDSFIGGAVLGGTLAPIGRFTERSAAKDQAARAEQAEKAEARKAQLLQQEQERAAAEAERNTPDYALNIGQQYDTLLADYQAKRAALTTPGKNATPVEKAEYADAQKEVKALDAQLKALVPEYRRTEKIRAQIRTEQQQAEEQARVAAMSPEEFAVAQAEQAPTLQAPVKARPVEGDPFETVQPIDVVQQYAASIKQLADTQMLTPPTVADYLQYALQDPIMADQMVKTATPMPGLTKRENAAFLGGLELNLRDIKQKRAQEAAVGTQSAQTRLAALESEEAEAGANVPPPFEQLAPGVGSEIMAMRRMAIRPPGGPERFMDLFGEAPDQPQRPSASIGQMQQRLTGEDVTFTGEEAPRAKRGEEAPFALRGRAEGTAAPVTREGLVDRINRVLTTYDLTPEAVDFLRRVEQTLPQSDTTIAREPQIAVVRGKPVRVGQDTGSYFELLDQQLERIESGQEGVPRKGERRSIELQAFPTGETRAETAPPTEATAEDIKKYRSAQPGQAQSMRQMEQAALEKRRSEGKGGRLPGFVYQPEEGERVAAKAGPTPVKKRVSDITPDTLRGESALPQDLSMARDVQEQLRLLETVADEGVQRPLFPEEQESVKLTRAGFQTYLKSPKVEALRKALRRDQEILKRAEQIPELEKRAKALVDEIDGILKSYAEYRSADAIVQANKDVTQARRDIAEIRAAAGKSTVNRMMLAGRVQQLQEARRDIVEEGRRQGETVEPDFLAELDAVTEAMQEAQTDLSLLDSALSTLDGQLRSFTALKKMATLVNQSVDPERIPAAQRELQAVKTELEKLREDYNEVNSRLRKEAADRKRAEAAVKEAERKALIEAGRVKPVEEMKEQLPAYDRAVQYPAITEAQRLAREKGGTLPELSEAEKIKIRGEPTQVLGGYRKEVTSLEKAIQNAQNSARESLRKQIVGPKQAAFDRVNKQYKAAKSAAERDVIGPRLDVAQRLLTRAEDKVSTMPITWRGMKRDIARLASAINKVEWLQGMIDAGRIEVEAPKTAIRRVTKAEAEKKAESERKVREATTRAEAPATSGEALTRSEAKRATQPKKTVFEGKGVPGGAAKEIPAEAKEGYRIAAKIRERLGLGTSYTTGTRTPVELTTQEALKDGRLLDALDYLAQIGKSPLIREHAAKLRPLVMRTKVVVDPELTLDGEAVPALYIPETNTVYLRGPEFTEEDVIHEVTHAATVQALTMPENKLTAEQLSAKRELQKIFETAKKDPEFAKLYATKDLLEFVSEVQSDVDTRAALDNKPWYKRLFAAIMKLVGLGNPTSERASKLIEALYLPSRKYEMPEGAAKALAAKPTAPSEDALTELSRKIIAQPKTFTQELRDLKALELEMAGVDARAALDEVLKRGAFLKNDDRDYKQAMYLVRKRDDLMSQMQAVMENGPPEMFRDEKGFLGVRTSGKDSALDLYRAVDKIPAKASQDKFSIASTYLAALRAADKGLEKLDVGALGVKQADLDAALAAANADPEMLDALNEVAQRYKAYNTGLVKFLADTGAIPKSMAEELLRGNYIPFYRVRANGMAELVFSDKMVFTVGDIRNQPYLAELKGGEEKIMPLNESLPRNTLLLMDKALTNLAERNVAYALQDMGKGKGPVDPNTGKPKDLMIIHKETSKASPDDARVIRFNQEPDPRDPKDDGRRWLMVESDGTAIEGVPAELVVKSLEGASLPLPGFLKLAGAASDLLRTGVTRTPLYIARQLYKEPMAATFTGGLNYTPFRAVLEAGKEYVRMMRGTSETQAKLIEKGLVQSQIFSGSPDDLKKVALQLARGGDQTVINKLFGALDRAAINADAATRALIYDNARKNGLSEVEAEHAAREAMNFSKRGSNALVQYGSRLIPFMNAQIQGLNVLIKAARGRMPFEEQLRIKKKFQNNAMLLFATGLVYAMAMEDDEYFKNARPRDKYTNFFLHLPGVEEPIKIATPFEAGYFFSLAVAAVDGMRRETNNAEQFAALRDMFLSSIPGYSSMGVPQIVKPAFEVFTNKNFLTGAPIESLRLRNMETADRYTESTTELAKAMSRALPILSPVQIEHIVRGYLGIAPIAAAAMINGVVPTPERGERPTTRASELPFLGSAFQRKMGGAQADEVYDLAEAAFQARQSYNERLKTGRAEEAKEFREERKVELAMAAQAGQYRQVIGRLNADIRRTQNRTDLTGEEKRARLDMLEQAKLDAANRFLQRYRDVENRLGS